MPYITKEKAANVRNDLATADAGDLNFLYTTEFVRMWKEKPGYATFHNISKCAPRPETDPGVWKLTVDARPHHKETDLLVARIEALAEFRRRIMSFYEDAKLAEEGRVDPYEEVESDLSKTLLNKGAKA